MQGTIQNYTLDMAAETAQRPLIVKQGDTNSRLARISLVAFKEPWTIPFGCQIHINVRKHDGTYANATCTQEDEHTVLAPITEQMTVVPGTQLGELFFLGSDGDIRSQTFPLLVWDAVSDLDLMASSNDFQALKDALRDVKISTDAAAIATQYATEQGNAARDSVQRAEDAADSLQVAVDAADAAKISETNAKASETAAAKTQREVTDYVESQKAAFVGYSKRETDSQYANAIIKTASGEGRVDVEDAWTAPVIGLDVVGRSEQVQTTGKNLFGGNALVEKLKTECSATVDGAKGTVTFTAPAISEKVIYTGFEEGKEYTIVFYGRNTGDESRYVNLQIVYSDGLYSTLQFETVGSDSYSIVHSNPKKSVVSLEGSWATKGTMLYYDKCGIFEGNVDLTAYEPYTGAAASPSPAYPQQIVSTGTVGTGAQLLDLRAGKSGTGVRNPWQATGTAYNDTIYPMVCEGPYAKPWEPYTGGKPAPSAEYPQPLEVRAVGKNLLEDRLYYAGYSGGIAYITNFYEVVLPYLPTRENFGVGKIVRCKKGVTYIFSVTNPNPNCGLAIAEYESIDASVNTKNKIGYKLVVDAFAPTAYTAISDGVLICVVAGAWTDGQTTIHECTESELLQCEVGSTATPYEPYRTAAATITLTEPLRGIGEYRDRLGYRDGVWGIERWIVKLMLDGSENWVVYNNASYAGFYLEKALPVEMNRRSFACNQAKYNENISAKNSLWLGVNGSKNMYATSNQFYDATLDDKGLANWKTHLAGHPLIINTYLDEPTWEPLPSATQQALNELTTYAGTTHLTITAGGPAPTVTLDYVQDTHKALEQCQEAAKEYTDNQIAAIVAALPTATQAAIVDNQTTRLLQEV